MPAFLKRCIREIAIAASAAAAERLLDDFPKNSGDRHVAEREDDRSNERNAEQKYGGMGEPAPEIARRPEGGHRVGLARQMRHDHQGGKGRKVLDRVDVSSDGGLAPPRQ